MIVVDASAVVEVLTGAIPAPELVELFVGEDPAAPHIVDTEVLNTLRGLERGRKLGAEVVDAARRDYSDLAITRYRIDALAERIRELRHNDNAYDASCLALAETLEVPVVTCDRKPASGLHVARVLEFSNL